MTTLPIQITSVPIDQLHDALGLRTPCTLNPKSLNKPLHSWQMEEDDSQILSYLYEQLRPKRHLEFGTWRGAGAVLCLEHSDATVWTINLLEGERDVHGEWCYYEEVSKDPSRAHWARSQRIDSKRTLCQTDALGQVGSLIHERGLGHRVCQIYCDSRKWDTTALSSNFFDTALIDGGHSREVVESDTRKAMSVLRPGGVVIWHDYCPDDEVLASCESPRGVVDTIIKMHAWLDQRCDALFWIQPSWLLIGVKCKSQPET